MIKLKKNVKGFTLAEEVITVILIGILVVAASGILINAIRIFSMNVISLNAQAKGIAVMDQLADNLTYAKEVNAVDDKNDFPTTTNSYQMILYPKTDTNGNYLYANTQLKYTSGSVWQAPADNKLCVLNSFEAEYVIQVDSANSGFAEIQLQVKRHDRTWYSEHRTVELKNNPFAAGTSFVYNSEDGKCLYIGCME